MAGLAGALVCAAPAQAYIDPNAGGFLFQMLSPLLAIGAGALLFLRDRILLLGRKLNPFAKRKAAGVKSGSHPPPHADDPEDRRADEPH
ncbi:MAG: hypothetical protein VX871_10505 [Pseudomonadota bacterium]|nr:hypothetical protein [Pseudomonadota bacterium]